MPNRVQTLRSSVPGNDAPGGYAPGGRAVAQFRRRASRLHRQRAQPAEASRGALVRVYRELRDRAISLSTLAPSTQAIAPSAAGAFTAANWTKIGTAQDLSLYLRLAGGTMSGPLTLAG